METIKPTESTVEAPEQKEEQEAKISLIKETLEMYLPEIIKLTEFALNKKRISIEDASLSEENKRRYRSLLIGTDKIALKILEAGSVVDKRVLAIKIALTPLIKEEIEINEDRQNGKKVSKVQEIKRKLGIFIPEDNKKSGEYMGKLADLLGGIGDTAKGKEKFILMALSKILKNEKVQEKVSEEVKEWIKDDGTEENADDKMHVDLEEAIGNIAEEFNFDLNDIMTAKF